MRRIGFRQVLPVVQLAVAAAALSCFAQDRFKSGDLKGFVKSPTEHIIEHTEEPFSVKSVKGTVLHGHYDETVPLADVIFEIRGPGNSEKIRGTKTDKQGRFRIRRVPPGSYAFKATLNGFRSVVGTIIVSKKADPEKVIRIRMLVGI